MRRFFTEYGLYALAVLAGFEAIGIFVSIYFKGGVGSLNDILQVWIGTLL